MKKNGIYCEPFHIQKGYAFEIHRVSYKKGDPYSCLMHFHEVHEIILFEQIDGTFFRSNGESKISDNDIVFTPAMETHHFEVEDTDKSWFVVQFVPGLVEELGLQNVAECLKYSAHFRLRDEDKADLRILVDWLSKAYQEDPFSDRSNTLLRLLLIWIADKTEVVMPVNARTDIGVTYSTKLAPVLNQFRHNNVVELSLVEAADLCNLSPSYFSRLFKSIFRCNYSEYVMQHKLYIAARLLSQSDSSITQISYDLNFSSPSHFIALFKKHFGKTPKKYKSEVSDRAERALTHREQVLDKSTE